MSRQWGWKLAEVMTHDPVSLQRIADCVGEIPALADAYAWACEFADVECVLAETLYLAAYDYDGRGSFRGWWRKKARGRLAMLRDRHFKKIRKASQDGACLRTISTEGAKPNLGFC